MSGEDERSLIEQTLDDVRLTLLQQKIRASDSDVALAMLVILDAHLGSHALADAIVRFGAGDAA